MRSAFLTACFLSATSLASVASAQEIIYRGSAHVISPSDPSETPTEELSLTLSGALAGAATLAYGAEWSTVVSVEGGRPAYRFGSLQGSLPAGLSTRETGRSIEFMGRTVSGRYGPFSVSVADSAGATSELTIPAFDVAPPSSPFTIGSPTVIHFQKGAPWSASFVASGGLAPYAIEGGQVTGDGRVERRVVPGARGSDHAGAVSVAPDVTIQVGEDATLSSAPVTSLDTSPTRTERRDLVVRNTGDFASASAPVVSISGGPFRIVSQDCTVPLEAGASCRAIVEPTGRSNAPFEGTASVAGLAGTVRLSGQGSGFSACSSAGDACGDGRFYLGQASSGHQVYGSFLDTTSPFKTYGQVAAKSGCERRGTGWMLAFMGDFNGMTAAVHSVFVRSGTEATSFWSRSDNHVGAHVFTVTGPNQVNSRFVEGKNNPFAAFCLQYTSS